MYIDLSCNNRKSPLAVNVSVRHESLKAVRRATHGIFMEDKLEELNVTAVEHHLKRFMSPF